MEAGTKAQDLREVEAQEGAPTEAPEAVKAAADAKDPKHLTTEDQADALDWLLSDETEEEESYSMKRVQINVGTPQHEKWIDWTIRNVDRDVLKALQQGRRSTRAQRRGTQPTEIDAEEVSLRVLVRGTVSPDLDKAVEAASKKGTNLASPDPDWGKMQILRHRFRNKPGLIDQLAGEIFDLSGYSDEAIRDSLEVRAAGN